MQVMTIKDLVKTYPSFKLKDVSFALEQGKITGFIGRNGAGKTTTLKSILHFLHPDSGEIRIFDLDFEANEQEIKRRIGFVNGGVDYYASKRLKTIIDVTRRFWSDWDEAEYRRYMTLFGLDEKKKISELSQGMKVKFALIPALSRHAELLILDEPTSGLDPVSRDELLDILLELADKGVTIFFSTHITSDLEKCADQIIYIKNGHIIADEELKTFVHRYRIVAFDALPDESPEQHLIGMKRTKEGYEGLVEAEKSCVFDPKFVRDADLETIMIHMEKEELI